MPMVFDMPGVHKGIKPKLETRAADACRSLAKTGIIEKGFQRFNGESIGHPKDRIQDA